MTGLLCACIGPSGVNRSSVDDAVAPTSSLTLGNPKEGAGGLEKKIIDARGTPNPVLVGSGLIPLVPLISKLGLINCVNYAGKVNSRRLLPYNST